MHDDIKSIEIYECDLAAAKRLQTLACLYVLGGRFFGCAGALPASGAGGAAAAGSSAILAPRRPPCPSYVSDEMRGDDFLTATAVKKSSNQTRIKLATIDM